VLGLVLVWVVAAVPLLGWLVAWSVMMVGTGALLLLWMGKAQKPAAIEPAIVAPPAQTPPVAPPMA